MSGFISNVKKALAIRAEAFRRYNHTVIPRRNRFGFLGVIGVSAVLVLAFMPRG